MTGANGDLVKRLREWPPSKRGPVIHAERIEAADALTAYQARVDRLTAALKRARAALTTKGEE